VFWCFLLSRLSYTKAPWVLELNDFAPYKGLNLLNRTFQDVFEVSTKSPVVSSVDPLGLLTL
jgi:hypothetical protein